MNTDRELWRERHPEGDAYSYYAPSIHVTEKGGIGINVDGFVIVKSLRGWHELAFPTAFPDIHERRLADQYDAALSPNKETDR